MTNKEALEYLTSKVFTGGNSILETEANVCKEIILKDLERLEEIKNDNILLKAEIEDLKYIEIANLKHSIDEKNEIIGDLKQDLQEEINNYQDMARLWHESEKENEKLKNGITKEITLLKERMETFWVVDEYDDYAVVREIIEELKEVLEDDK